MPQSVSFSKPHAVDWRDAHPHPDGGKVRECQRLQESTRGGQSSETALMGDGILGQGPRNQIEASLQELWGIVLTAVIRFIPVFKG